MNAAPALTIPSTAAIRSLFLLIMNMILSSMFTPLLINALAILFAFLLSSSYVSSPSSATSIVFSGFSQAMFSNILLMIPSFASSILKSSSYSSSFLIEISLSKSSSEPSLSIKTSIESRKASISSFE